MNETPVLVFEDNHVLVAIKPPGVLSQADGGASTDMLTLLRQDIKIRHNKPGEVFLGLVHRLDQPVGGLMVFARTSKAAARLSAQVREHRLDKIYLTIVKGRPEPDAGCLEDWLIKDPVTRQVHVAESGTGQHAQLDYRVLSYDPTHDVSLLAVRLGTGRGHQIRVQLQSRGWPILNDHRYGTQPTQSVRRRDIALFAAGLGFEHPVRRDWLSFSAELPAVPPWSWFEPSLTKNAVTLFNHDGLREDENGV